MPAVLTIGKTELKYGYVYFLHNRLRHDDDIPREDVVAAGLGDLLPDESEWIASPGPPVPKGERENSHVEVRTDEREVERYKCSLNAAHGRTSESINYKLDLLYVMQSIPPFVNDAEDAHVLVNEWLAERLKGSGLKGFRLLPTEVRLMPDWFVDGKSTPLSKVYQLAFDGRFPRQLPRVLPASADKCPHCGTGPIVCSACGFFYNQCSKCGEMWGVPADQHGGRDDPRILIERLGIGIDVVDPRRWDGCDFMGWSSGGWITRRALDWFLSIHAGPFVAQPIAVNVLGLTKEERERLETMRRPLPGVEPLPLENFAKKSQEKTGK